MIDDWYTQVETETAQLFQRTEENCKQYFILMSTQTEHTYKAMNRAADKVYDSVYDDVRDGSSFIPQKSRQLYPH